MKKRYSLLLLAILGLIAMRAFGILAAANSNKAIHLTALDSTVIPSAPLVLPDGRIFFKAEAIMTVSSTNGDLVGTLTEDITQIWKPNPSGLRSSTVLWKLETADGVMKGYYSGYFKEIGEQAMINSHGEVLAVTEMYADYYQATVTVQALLNLVTFDVEGEIVIQPRNKK